MYIPPATSGLPSAGDPSIAPAPDAAPDGGFARIIDRVLEQMSAPGRAADQAVHDLAMGRTENLHQVLLAVSQADVAFRLVLEIRNKLIEAYQEIQRMQV